MSIKINNSHQILTYGFRACFILLLCMLQFSCGLNTVLKANSKNTDAEFAQKQKNEILKQTMSMQLPFIENQGQIAGDQVRYYAKTFGGTAYVTQQGEMVYSFAGVGPENKAPASASTPKNIKGVILKETLVGAFFTHPKGEDQAQTKVNYFIGEDKSKWKTNITAYNSISLGEVYKGVELSLKAYGKTVEKVFTVNPGADPEKIKLKIEGTESLSILANGKLGLKKGAETICFSKPVAFQEVNGIRENINVAYQLHADTYGFIIGDYNREYPLVIDPILSYSTYLGGLAEEVGNDIAVDSAGMIYVTGYTFSGGLTFALNNNHGDSDLFVAKFDPSQPSASTLVYFTFIGGSNADEGNGIAVDSSGNAYVTGKTESADYPTVNPYKPNPSILNNFDVLVSVINSSGSALNYSTLMGSTLEDDIGQDIAIDNSGNIYITGTTEGDTFPTTSNAYSELSFGTTGNPDAFVAKIDPAQAGTAQLVYSTFYGGTQPDYSHGIDVDSSGNIYITGGTGSSTTHGFPITLNAFQAENKSGDAFVAKFDLTQTGADTLVYSTYLGGNGTDNGGFAIDVDSSGNAYIAGLAFSPDFPTKNGYQSSPAGQADAFVAIIQPSSVIWSRHTCLLHFAWRNRHRSCKRNRR